MKHLFHLNYLLLFSLIIFVQNRKLSLVIEIFRHGARYPAFPNIKDKSIFASQQKQIGQLTTQGKRMQYILGRAIYQKYWKKLFGGTINQYKYNQSVIYVKSTNMNRTLQSAQTQLIGLLEKLPPLQLPKEMNKYSLPPFDNMQKLIPDQQEINKNQIHVFGSSINSYHSIPIHTQRQTVGSNKNSYDQSDFLLRHEISSCPNQVFWIKQNMASIQAKTIMNNAQVKDAISKLEEQLGQSVQFQNAYKYIDNYLCLKYMGRSYLPIFDEPNYVEVFIVSMYLQMFHNKDQIQAVSTDMLTSIHNLLKKKDKSEQKLILFSAHDTTLANLLASMNFTNVKCINEHYLNNVDNSKTCIFVDFQFAANLIFQLWQHEDKSYIIRINLNGRALAIPFCNWKIQCPLQTFSNWIQQSTVANTSEACGIKSDYFQVYIIILLALLAIFMLFILGMKLKITSIRKKQQQKVEQYHSENFV